MPQPLKIGFLGLGQMGAPMAERLFGPDILLHVHDPRPDAMAAFVARGARAFTSPKDMADEAEIIFACLPSAEISEAAAFGAEGLIHGKSVRIHAEMSTIGTRAVQRIGQQLEGRKIGFVDAPISGGPPGARAGSLAMMAAGKAALIDELEPILLKIGKKVFRMGEEIGAGQLMKLVNNMLVAANMVTAFEAFAMGAKGGLDADLMVDVVNAGTGRSYVSEQVMECILSRRFGYGATIDVLDKDVSLGLEEAKRLNVPMWGLEQASRLWRFAASQGAGTRDMSELATFMEAWAGAEICGKPAK
ncbi:MAG: NAD(P)-dependent oxidoreductase [Burkholderiales bacterium]|nr:NAD(P)-dependent oxidoreductase [Burkholderiales bacterium]